MYLEPSSQGTGGREWTYRYFSSYFSIGPRDSFSLTFTAPDNYPQQEIMAIYNRNSGPMHFYYGESSWSTQIGPQDWRKLSIWTVVSQEMKEPCKNSRWEALCRPKIDRSLAGLLRVLLVRNIDPVDVNGWFNKLSTDTAEYPLIKIFCQLVHLPRRWAGATFPHTTLLSGNTGILAGEPASQYERFSRGISAQPLQHDSEAKEWNLAAVGIKLRLIQVTFPDLSLKISTGLYSIIQSTGQLLSPNITKIRVYSIYSGS